MYYPRTLAIIEWLNLKFVAFFRHDRSYLYLIFKPT